MDLLSKLVEQLCDCEGRRLNGQARELANDIRERLAALRPVIEKLVETGQQLRAYHGPTVKCIGFPDCDGDLPGEPHSAKCLAQRTPSLSDKWDAALESWKVVNGK